MSLEASVRKPGTYCEKLIQVSEPNRGNDEHRYPSDSSARAISKGGCLPRQSLEKELFEAVRCKTIDECDDLLVKIQNINAMRENGETPLHLAVLLGKLEWAECLLLMGSDPNIMDKAGVSTLLVAEEMCRAFPLDSERKSIHRLVKLTSKLDRKGRDAPKISSPGSETSRVPSVGDLGETEAVGRADSSHGNGDRSSSNLMVVGSREVSLRSNVEERLENLTSLLIELSQKVDSLSTETASLKEGTETLVDNASITGTAISELRMEMAGVKSQVLSDLKEVKLETVSGNAVNKIQLHGVRESIDQMQMDMRNRDILLRSLEAGMTSLAEEMRSSRSEYEDDDDDSEPDSEIDEVDRRECSDGLTDIAQYHGQKECLENLTSYFDDMYSQGSLLSSMLRYMHGQNNWEMLVDFENSDIGTRWPDLKDLEGKFIGDSGPKVRSHASRRMVYVAARIQGVYTEDRLCGWLAIGMARMAMLLAFRNRCKPYSKGNRDGESKFKAVVIDAEQQLSRLGARSVNWYIKNALEWKTQEAKEIALISAVPGIIAHHSRPEGIQLLREQLPSLLNYYQDYVVSKFKQNTHS